MSSVRWLLFALLVASPLLAQDDLVPLNDLGARPYHWGYIGGLYDDSENGRLAGSNEVPPEHLAAGLRIAQKIQPLDANGQPSPSGKVVMLVAGFDETSRIVCGPDPYGACDDGSFMAMAARNPRVRHDSLVIANAAYPGFDGWSWTLPSSPNYERIKNSVLAPAGVTEKQVQVAWVQMVQNNPGLPLPIQHSDAYRLKNIIAAVVCTLKARYPNLQIAYLSSRVYGGYATTAWNPEPFAYETAFSNRWVIMGQVTLMRTGSLWDTRIGDISYETGIAPWLAWGPYLWADGPNPRSDGLTWQRDDFEADGERLTPSGAHKGAVQLLEFLLHEPTAQNWFVAPSVPVRRRASH